MVFSVLAGSVPLQGSEVAIQWDNLYDFLVWLSVFFFVLVVGGMLYFIYAYRYHPKRKTTYFTGNHVLEAIWIAVPTLLLMVIFGWGYVVYNNMVQAPLDPYEVRVIGKQWLWTFQYDDGRTSIGEVFVPLNRPVKLVMTSEDVLHSFFIPNFRVKQDVVPGMYSSVWFTATVPGKHQVYCAEYCGTSHSEMLAKVVVLDDRQWEDWIEKKTLGNIPEAGQEMARADSIRTSAASRLVSHETLADQGRNLYRNKGCVACHSVDGTTKIGPSHKNLYGRRVALEDGREVVADENFIRSHIENPRLTAVKGFSQVMPTFKGLLTEQEMNALIAYIRSLRE